MVGPTLQTVSVFSGGVLVKEATMLAWIPQTFDAACKRAAGRRRYHAQRRRARDKRQLTP